MYEIHFVHYLALFNEKGSIIIYKTTVINNLKHVINSEGIKKVKPIAVTLLINH